MTLRPGIGVITDEQQSPVTAPCLELSLVPKASGFALSTGPPSISDTLRCCADLQPESSRSLERVSKRKLLEGGWSDDSGAFLFGTSGQTAEGSRQALEGWRCPCSCSAGHRQPVMTGACKPSCVKSLAGHASRELYQDLLRKANGDHAVASKWLREMEVDPPYRHFPPGLVRLDVLRTVAAATSGQLSLHLV